MKIGIIFAMKEELDAFKKKVTIREEKTIYNCTFYDGSFNNNNLVLLESGVGKVNAARCCQMLIDYYNVDYVFNVGVAGSTLEEIKIGDIVVGEKLVQYDFDITAFNHEKGYIPNIGVFIPTDDELISIALDVKDTEKIHKGVIASGDAFCTSYDICTKLYDDFGALCVEMEGASVAQVAYLAGIPSLVIRSISDSPCEGDNVNDYEKFLEESVNAVAEYLIKVIGKLKIKE